MRTEPCNRRAHPFAHLLTLKILIWHSNASDWQLRHAALTDQTWFTMRVCEREKEKQRERAPVRWKWAEFGVRIVNLTVTYHVIHLSDALCTLTHSFSLSLSLSHFATNTHTHTSMYSHTFMQTQISTHDAPPALPAIHSNPGDNQSACSVLFCFVSFARFCFRGLHHCQICCSSPEDSSST